jgi:FAD/FMN-containing dehydrogenase
MLAAPEDFMRETGAWGAEPATIEIMRRLKKAFDPAGTLNPGRFVV